MQNSSISNCKYKSFDKTVEAFKRKNSFVLIISLFIEFITQPKGERKREKKLKLLTYYLSLNYGSS